MRREIIISTIILVSSILVSGYLLFFSLSNQTYASHGTGDSPEQECSDSSDCPNYGDAVYDSTGTFCGNCAPSCENTRDSHGERQCGGCGCGFSGSNGGGDDGSDPPIVDLDANGSDGPITVDYNTSVLLSWDSHNSSDCQASDGWSGGKPDRGSERTGNLTSSQTFTLTCFGPRESRSDSVTVNVNIPPPSTDINSSPSTVNWNQSSTLSWSSSNTSSCNASGDWSGGKPLSGSESTGNLTQVRTHNYTLTCSGPGGSNQDTVSVVVAAPVPTTSSVSVVTPNYCTTGPSITANWSFSDPSGSPQQSYQVQVDNQPSFGSPELDSGKITCESCRSYYGGLGILQFNTTYSARVRTWNTYDSPSAWQEATSCSGTDCNPNGSWKTPSHAYPNPNGSYQFTWSPTNPPIGQPVQFTDRTLFDPSSNNKAWSWTFVPAGGGSGSSTDQSPVYSFNSEGIYQVTQSVRDNAVAPGQYCAGPTQAVNLQKPIPVWKEVAPK